MNLIQKISTNKIRRRAFSLVSCLVLSLGTLISVGGVASAYTYGTTWFSNGTRSASGTYGSSVSAYAVGAVPGRPYKLVSGKNGCTTSIVPINQSIVYAGSNGIIGTVQGTINRGTGTYDVCFYSVYPGAEGQFTTSPATFEVRPVIQGSTWFSDGTKSKSGPAGSTVSAYAVGAYAYAPYKLVSGRNGCTTDIVPINPTVVYAGSNGIIGKVTGTINRLPGTYDVCFYSAHSGAEGILITSLATFTVY